MAIYLAHATSFCSRVWTPVIDALDDLETVIWDFAGHGSGPTLDLPVDWARFGEQVLDETEPGGIGVGHSMGAAAIAMAQVQDPTRFRGLILIEPIIFPGPHVRVEHFLSPGALKRKREFPSREAALANFASRQLFARWHPDALAGYVECGFRGDGPVTLVCDPEIEADIYRASNDHDTWDRLHMIEVPVLVMVGAESDTISGNHPRSLTSLMPKAGLEVVDGAGHFLAMERPDLVAARTRRLAAAVQDSAR